MNQDDIAPVLSRLIIYPIKSLDGLAVPCAKLYPEGGGLWGDRLWAIYDDQGEVVNGKGEPKIFTLRAQFAQDLSSVTLAPSGRGAEDFSLTDEDLPQLNRYLSDYFGYEVTIRRNDAKGFPDYETNPGPSVVSLASLKAVQSWFPEMALEEVRRRFRTSLEIDGVPAFWEDCLFKKKGEWRSFQIGSVKFRGIGPIQRCPVPTRNPESGEIERGFQRQFIKSRMHTVRDDGTVCRERFDTFYYLAVKTQVENPSAGELSLGQALVLGS